MRAVLVKCAMYDGMLQRKSRLRKRREGRSYLKLERKGKGRKEGKGEWKEGGKEKRGFEMNERRVGIACNTF